MFYLANGEQVARVEVTLPVPSPLASTMEALVKLWNQAKNILLKHWPYVVSGAVLTGVVVGGTIYFYLRLSRKFKKGKKRHDFGDMAEVPGAKGVKYAGLINVGNSCYLNCILQSLASVHDVVSTPAIIRSVEENDFVRELFTLTSQLNVPKKRTLKTSSLIRAMGGVLNREQHDACEMLQAIMSVLAKHHQQGESHRVVTQNTGGLSDLIQSTADAGTGAIIPRQGHLPAATPALAPWEGLMNSWVKCLSCGEASGKGPNTTIFSLLTLSVESPSVTRALAKLTEPELIPDYLCSNTNCQARRGHCAKLGAIVRWPQVLMLHIQRTTITPFGQPIKHTEHIDFGEKISLPLQPTHLMGLSRNPEAFTTATSTTPTYQLMAVVQHHGGLSIGAGHYTAFRRVWKDSQKSSCWWLYASDEVTQIVPLDTVLSAQAYILFYVPI